MDQEMKRKYMALAILANSGNIKREQLCAELRKIPSIDELLFVLDRITDAVALRRGLNVFTHHRDFTLRALFVVLPESHYRDHQDILGNALLRHNDFKQWQLCRFLEQVGPDVGGYVIDQLAKDQKYQPLLIDILRDWECPSDQIRDIAEAIVRHPLTIEQLTDLITETDHKGAKLAFAKIAAATEHLSCDILLEFFRQIEGDAQREVEFIDAVHLSADETFFILLTDTEFESTRKVCVRKLKCCTHSIATTEYWRKNAERHIRPDAIRWFDTLLADRYEALPAPQLLDILVDLRDSDQTKRDMILNVLSRNTHQLREIAGIVRPK